MFRIPVVRKQEKLISQQRTAVAGVFPGCGVSFVSALLGVGTAALPGAEDSLSGCTLAEMGTPGFYTAINIEKRFAEGDFVFYEDALERRQSLLTVKNSFRGLNLMLRRPDAPGSAPSICACKMPGSQVVFDLSGLSEDALDEVLPHIHSAGPSALKASSGRAEASPSHHEVPAGPHRGKQDEQRRAVFRAKALYWRKLHQPAVCGSGPHIQSGVRLRTVCSQPPGSGLYKSTAWLILAALCSAYKKTQEKHIAFGSVPF